MLRFGIREIMLLFILLAVPVAAWKFVFQPRNEEIVQARAEISEKQLRLTMLDKATEKIHDLGAAIESGREAIEMIEAKLPAEQNIDQILRQVWKIADRHLLKIRFVEPKKKVPASQYMELPITVDLTGNFDGFYQFLIDLEEMPRLTRLKDLEMERVDSYKGTMDAVFVLSIYFEPYSEQTASVTGDSR